MAAELQAAHIVLVDVDCQHTADGLLLRWPSSMELFTWSFEEQYISYRTISFFLATSAWSELDIFMIMRYINSHLHYIIAVETVLMNRTYYIRVELTCNCPSQTPRWRRQRSSISLKAWNHLTANNDAPVYQQLVISSRSLLSLPLSLTYDSKHCIRNRLENSSDNDRAGFQHSNILITAWHGDGELGKNRSNHDIYRGNGKNVRYYSGTIKKWR